MFVACPECKNHFDDAYQSEDCEPERSGHSAPNPYHRIIGEQPIAEANRAAKEARVALAVRTGPLAGP